VTADIQAPKTISHMQQIECFVTGEPRVPPIAKSKYIRVAAEIGQVIVELAIYARMMDRLGIPAGCVICDLSDATIGSPMATTLEEDETFATIDVMIKFLQPVQTSPLRAEALVDKRTRTLGLIECVVTDKKGSLVAKAISICTVLRERKRRVDSLRYC
jgi:uncharacterized protein (TIGR00369 family)